MARIVFASSAHADSAAILTDLLAMAGRLTAMKFDRRFEELFDRLVEFPDSGALRPAVGRDIRVGIVAPYVVIFRYLAVDDTVTVMRIVHGRRKISGKLLSGSVGSRAEP